MILDLEYKNLSDYRHEPAVLGQRKLFFFSPQIDSHLNE